MRVVDLTLRFRTRAITAWRRLAPPIAVVAASAEKVFEEASTVARRRRTADEPGRPVTPPLRLCGRRHAHGENKQAQRLKGGEKQYSNKPTR
jgi:hypothetical protein